MRTTRPLADRLWEKVQKVEGDGCWEWVGKAVSAKGYGILQRGRRGQGTVGAHRVAWEVTYGPVPEGLCVMHNCDNPPCCRPDHLFLGTIGDNNRDMTSKGRSWQQKKQICPAGHEYTEANTYVTATGSRRCRACLKAQKHARYLDPSKSR